MITEDMKRLVGEQRLGFVATVSPDGTPNLSPKGTTIVWDDDHLAFADLRSPQTIANLRTNPAVEVNLVDQVVRKGYRFKGTAEILTEGSVYDEIVTFFESQRNVARSRINAVVYIEVKEARPLISPAYDTGASEEEVSAEWRRYWAELGKT